jgi:phosphatidylglycerophosphate synthase
MGKAIMNKEKKKKGMFSFKKSLKSDSKYPILNYFRVERYFTRPLASLIVRAVFNTRITPNQITWVSFFIAILSSAAFCMGQPTYFLVAGILVQLSSIVDCADGMLARSKEMCTPYGAYLDLFLDRITDFLIFSSINIGYFLYARDIKIFVIGAFSIALYFLQVSLYYLMKNYRKNDKLGEAAEERGLIIFVILVFSVLNRLDILIYALLLETALNVIIKFVMFIRWGQIKQGDGCPKT